MANNGVLKRELLFYPRDLSLPISHYSRVSVRLKRYRARKEERKREHILPIGSHVTHASTAAPSKKLWSHRPLTILESCTGDLFSSKVKSESAARIESATRRDSERDEERMDYRRPGGEGKTESDITGDR